MASPELKYIGAALHDFLAQYDIPNREQVSVLIVAPDQRSGAMIEAAIRRSIEPHEFAYATRNHPRADIVLEGIPISVRVPKQVVEV